MKRAVDSKQIDGIKNLNDLFKDGYEVESIDGNGIYILNKVEMLKAHAIDTDMTVELNLDTSSRQTPTEMSPAPEPAPKRNETGSTPHIRIEFDNIRDVPKVWVDGKRDYKYMDHHIVPILDIDTLWHG